MNIRLNKYDEEDIQIIKKYMSNVLFIDLSNIDAIRYALKVTKKVIANEELRQQLTKIFVDSKNDSD